MYDITSLERKLHTAEYLLQNSTCRLCWNSDAEIEIMTKSENKTGSGGKPGLSDIVLVCLDIVISPGSRPNKVCSTCTKNIEFFQSFREFCQEADKRLHKILPKPSQVATVIKNEKRDILNEETEKSHVKVQSPKRESFDEFLDTLCPSDDEIPLKELKKRNLDLPIKTERKKKLKQSNTYCNICKIQFDCTEVFTRHNFESHGIENGLYHCFGCEKKMKTRRGRASHETYFCKALKNGYKCTKCEKLLPSRRFYEKHMKNHRNNVTEMEDVVLKCGKCNETFTSREKMRNHAQLLHGDKKKYICESCGRSFSRRDYLNKHVLTHTGARAHVCAQCGFRAAQKSTLTVHMRKHSGERPYGCDLCPQRCVSSSNLRAHRRMHAGLKRHECTLCNKKFGYKMSLEEHIASTHERAPAHACAHCGAAYSRRRGLSRHVAQKHKPRNDEDPGGNNEFRSKSDEFGSKSDEFRSNGDEFRSNGDEFRSKSDEFRSNSGEFRSNRVEFRGKSDEFRNKSVESTSKNYGFRSKNDETINNGSKNYVLGVKSDELGSKVGCENRDDSLNRNSGVDNSICSIGEVYGVLVTENIGDGVKI